MQNPDDMKRLMERLQGLEHRLRLLEDHSFGSPQVIPDVAVEIRWETRENKKGQDAGQP